MAAHLRSLPHEACLTRVENTESAALRPLELVHDIQNAVRELDDLF